MPGFRIGVEDGETGIPQPARVVYTYTWKLIDVSGQPLIDTIYPKECTLPDYAFEEEAYQAPDLKYKYAKGVNWNDVKITFYDTDGLKEQLNELKGNVWGPEDGIRTADKYKFDSTIEVYFSDDKTLAQSWQLVGSWVKAVSWGPLTYASSDVHNVAITLSYDWARLK